MNGGGRKGGGVGRDNLSIYDPKAEHDSLGSEGRGGGKGGR